MVQLLVGRKKMRKLIIVCVFSLLLGFLSSSVFAIQYCKDFLEPENPGGWGTSLKTFDEEVWSCPGAQPELDIWINDIPEPLITAGFWIVYSPLIEIEDVLIYDGSDLPGPWNPSVSGKVPEPDGPGTYFVVVGGWSGSPYTPIIPDSDGDIIIGKIIFRKLVPGGHYPITISTVPGFDTIVGESNMVYDGFNPNTIWGTEYSCALCCTYISTEDQTTINPGGTIDFDASSSGQFCNTPTALIFSDNCIRGDIDPITGIFTADTTISSEDCQVCVVDNANTDSCDDPFCGSTEGCCADVTISSDFCDCEGNFDNDQDQDGSDAATFKVDFGRSVFLNPCTNSLPCNGDFECDSDVDGTDAALFKEDFGRSPFSNPCPICPTDPWCTYP